MGNMSLSFESGFLFVGKAKRPCLFLPARKIDTGRGSASADGRDLRPHQPESIFLVPSHLHSQPKARLLEQPLFHFEEMKHDKSNRRNQNLRGLSFGISPSVNSVCGQIDLILTVRIDEGIVTGAIVAA